MILTAETNSHWLCSWASGFKWDKIWAFLLGEGIPEGENSVGNGTESRKNIKKFNVPKTQYRADY